MLLHSGALFASESTVTTFDPHYNRKFRHSTTFLQADAAVTQEKYCVAIYNLLGWALTSWDGAVPSNSNLGSCNGIALGALWTFGSTASRRAITPGPLNSVTPFLLCAEPDTGFLSSPHLPTLQTATMFCCDLRVLALVLSYFTAFSLAYPTWWLGAYNFRCKPPHYVRDLGGGNDSISSGRRSQDLTASGRSFA